MIIYLSDIYVRKSPFLKGAFLFLNMSEQVISHEKIAINDEFSTFYQIHAVQEFPLWLRGLRTHETVVR